MQYINEIDGKGYGSSWIAKSYPLPQGSQWEGLCFHTDETGPYNTIEQAIKTLRFQASAVNISGGSYHFIICKLPSGEWAALRTVRADRAAGGIGTNPATLAPERYPELKQFLTPATYADPNRGIMHVCITGQTAKLAIALPFGLAKACADLVTDFENDKLTPTSGTGSRRKTTWGAFLNNHYQWQTNRIDPGKLLVPMVMRTLNPPMLLPDAPLPKPTPAPAPTPTIDYKAKLEVKNKAIDVAIASATATLEQLKKARNI